MTTINSTQINPIDVLDYYADNFPFADEDNDFNVSSTNQTFYDDYILNNTQALNFTSSDTLSFSSIVSFSSPFSYIFLILIVYSVLTLILLSLSLYKQRQIEIDNFYFGDSDEEVEKAKHYSLWKQFLIGKITKGDIEPLLADTNSNSAGVGSESKATTFPLEIV